MTRISSGSDSKQDYRTPSDLIEACRNRFGDLLFDLAAHADNTQSPHYFAPAIDRDGRPLPVDPKAEGIDAFEHSWAEVFKKYSKGKLSGNEFLWLNPEFDDIAAWAKRCASAASLGATIVFLTPAAVGSNWFRDLIAPHADVYLLNGRPSFIPKQTYNKDCMISRFSPDAQKSMCIWQWKTGEILQSWR
jgi:hypothetical protein